MFIWHQSIPIRCSSKCAKFTNQYNKRTPGTGKTQTILNIIANLIMQGKSIAVVSNNNAATQNVFEKLQEYELDYLCATLGNKDNKESFIKNQPKIPKHLNTTEKNDTLLENIKKLNKMIHIFTLQNKKAKEQEPLNDFKAQSKYATFP
ncbi:AAA domain-containing protein [Helicobacter trogontum]|uniref:AAA domain-containing protein n=1 Tax=Helicobacter trogontum TaxID=50960 RepID=UPI0018F81A99|nr:AAA domain-containing protein [Helicobacter trogontum]